MLPSQNMRQIIYKEVKRPGRNHERLFQMLRELHGPRHVRKDYISEVRNRELSTKASRILTTIQGVSYGRGLGFT